jgi:hypothetical protein
MSNTFLLSWDCQGIEAVVNVTEYEKEQVWAELKNEDGPAKWQSVVSHLMMRARANPQRHYEIYTINVEEGIGEDDVREMFEQDPQGSADLIRDRGNQIYSDRVDRAEVKIV